MTWRYIERCPNIKSHEIISGIIRIHESHPAINQVFKFRSIQTSSVIPCLAETLRCVIVHQLIRNNDGIKMLRLAEPNLKPPAIVDFAYPIHILPQVYITCLLPQSEKTTTILQIAQANPQYISFIKLRTNSHIVNFG